VIAQQEEEPERYSDDWWLEMLLDIPLRVVGLILLAVIARYLLHRLINRLVRRAETSRPPERVLGSKQAARIVFGSTGAYSERRVLRARTLGSLARSIVTAVISPALRSASARRTWSRTSCPA
jgi:small conductance mechanosensitive channel